MTVYEYLTSIYFVVLAVPLVFISFVLAYLERKDRQKEDELWWDDNPELYIPQVRVVAPEKRTKLYDWEMDENSIFGRRNYTSYNGEDNPNPKER